MYLPAGAVIISVFSTMATMLLILLVIVIGVYMIRKHGRHLVGFQPMNTYARASAPAVNDSELKTENARYVQLNPLSTEGSTSQERGEAVSEFNGNPERCAENNVFDEYNEIEGEQKIEDTAENPSTPPEREDTLHRTEMSPDFHTPSSMTPSPGPAEPRNVFDENDDVFELGLPISPGTSQTQKRKPNRPRSASRRLSGADYQELPEETTSPPTVPAHPSRPGSASKSGRRYSLSHMRSSVSLDPTEIESLLDTDTAPAPKSQ